MESEETETMELKKSTSELKEAIVSIAAMPSAGFGKPGPSHPMAAASCLASSARTILFALLAISLLVSLTFAEPVYENMSDVYANFSCMGDNIMVQVRSDSLPNMSGRDFVGYDNTSSTWFLENQAELNLMGLNLSGARYFQYRAYLYRNATLGQDWSPNIHSATIGYANYTDIGTVAITSPAYAFTTLNCSTTAHSPTGTIVNATLAWLRNGALNSTSTAQYASGAQVSATLSPAAGFTVGDTWNCTVNASDGTTQSPNATAGVTISEYYPDTYATMNSVYAGFSSIGNNILAQARSCANPDCSDGTFIGPDNTSATWFDSSPANLSSTNISSARYIQYRAYLYRNATLGQDWSPNLASATAGAEDSCGNLTVQNSVPVINSSRITPTTAYTTSTLNGYGNATDADGDNLSYNYTFFRNGVANQTGSFNATTQGIERNVANYTGTKAVGDNFTLEIMAFDGTNYTALLNSSTITILNAAYGNGSVTQEIAVANTNVHWNATVTLTNGTGTCAYAILQYGVKNLTVITNSSGAAKNHTGNYTNPSWACDIAESPYTVNFYTEPVVQTSNQVNYGLSGSEQMRFLFSTQYAQNIAYAWNYTPSVPNFQLRYNLCLMATSAACNTDGSYQVQSYSLSGGTMSKTLTLVSNETVAVVTWDLTYGTSEAPSSSSSPTVPVATPNETQNTTIPPLQSFVPGEQEDFVVEASLPQKLLAGASETGQKIDEWAGSQTYVGDVGVGNWLVAEGLLGILMLISITLYVSSRADRKPPAFVLCALFFGVLMAYVAFKYAGGVGA